MKKYQAYPNKSYSKKFYGEPREKWDHGGYDALVKEDTKTESSSQNYYFRKKKDDNSRYGKEEGNSKSNHFKQETQLLKCYMLKTDVKSEKNKDPVTLVSVEKPEEKESVVLEDKLSNVSTSFSSKEKPMEEDINTPILHSFKKSDSTSNFERNMPVFQININFPSEKVSIEIFHEDEIEDKINEIVFGHKTNELSSLAARIFVLNHLKQLNIFSQELIEKLLDKLLDSYEKCKNLYIEKIEEIVDEEF